MDPRYAPEGVEARWQEAWEAEGLYAAGAGARRGETYVICDPPPNVTGDLTWVTRSTLDPGHARSLAPDARVRHALAARLRPCGHLDQNVVGRALAKEGKSPAQDSDARVLDAHVREWLEKTGRTIMSQFRRVGCSLDYSRSASRWTTDYSAR